ncbi:unnamed protein product [marine sediment metagenome]|uniref:Uncharacterized protein n=1 Tax=marine sediment metagenome TaxID=412755 RepID=X1LYQ1_9ZZZZ
MLMYLTMSVVITFLVPPQGISSVYFISNIKNPVNKKNYNERTYYLEILKNMNIVEINLLKVLYTIGKEINMAEIIGKF